MADQVLFPREMTLQIYTNFYQKTNVLPKNVFLNNYLLLLKEEIYKKKRSCKITIEAIYILSSMYMEDTYDRIIFKVADASYGIGTRQSVTLRRPFDFEKWVEKWVEKLTDNRVKILREVHNNPKVTKKELEQAVSISASSIDNNIDILKNLGLLTREGSDKGGNWRINYLVP